MFDAISILACIVVDDVSPWVHNPWQLEKRVYNTKCLKKEVSPCKTRCLVM
jgi:hypothetical protein